MALNIPCCGVFGLKKQFLWDTIGTHFIPNISTPLYMNLIVYVLILQMIGEVISLWGIFSLRECFSVLPEARKVVSTGPFRYIKHPIYTGYTIVMISQALIFQRIYYAVGAVISIVFFIVSLTISTVSIESLVINVSIVKDIKSTLFIDNQLIHLSFIRWSGRSDNYLIRGRFSSKFESKVCLNFAPTFRKSAHAY